MSEPRAQRSTLYGYIAALIGVLLTATYPAMTRPSFVGNLSAADLLVLRVGVSAMLFAPYLAWKARKVPRQLWVTGLPLSFFQGWGMAALVIVGLQLAPASHSSSLGPGMLSTSVALLGFLLYGIRVERMQSMGIALIVGGVILILTGSGATLGTQLIGDVMFVMASAFGAFYLLSVQQKKLAPILAAAIVSVYSAVVVVPWYFLVPERHLATSSAYEIVIQVFVQGILRGGVCFVALNYSIATIGSQRTSILYALLPALGLVSSISIAADPASWMDWGAVAIITAGVVMGTLARKGRKNELQAPLPSEEPEPKRA